MEGYEITTRRRFTAKFITRGALEAQRDRFMTAGLAANGPIG
jgi:hypothetical protein